MLTTDELRSKGNAVKSLDTVTRYSRTHGTKLASKQATIFLSHSHRDADLIDGAAKFLNEFGVTIYVDWGDDSMPAVTSHITASKIKVKILENTKFIVLATNNACASRWVPWELGIADVMKSIKHIAILPVADPSGHWTGNEYIGIYPSFVETAGSWRVVQPGQNAGGMSVRDWLSS